MRTKPQANVILKPKCLSKTWEKASLMWLQQVIVMKNSEPSPQSLT